MPRAVVSTTAGVAPLRQAWEAHLADHVVRLEWSPDGTLLAVALIGGPILIFTSSGAFVQELRGHSFGTLSISWHAGSRLLASGGQDGVARIWEAMSGALLHELSAGAQWVEQVAFSPKKDYLVTGAGRHVKLWNSTGELLRNLPDHPSTIADIAWQPGDLYFATAAYGQVGNFHAENGEFAKFFAWKGSILVVAWSGDGNYVATGNQDASVHFWYRKSGRDLEMTGYPAKVRELSWDASSRYLATGGSPLVTIWDCGGKGPSGTRPLQLEGHQGFVSALAFQSKGKLIASGCQTGCVYLWSLKTPRGSLKTPRAPIRGSELGEAITQIRWAPDDGLLAASSEAGLVRVFERAGNE